MKCNNHIMNKKVLLKELVETGRHIRKEFTSKVRVSDEGVYPIGELWDANTTLDVIVNGAHQQHDTIRELDTYAHNLDTIKVGRSTVSDVKSMTSSAINSANVGDTIIDSSNNISRAYTVTHKTDTECDIVYADRSKVEEVHYTKQNDTWTYTGTNTITLSFKTIGGQSVIGDGNIDVAAIATGSDAFQALVARVEALETAIQNNNPNTEE